MQFFYISYNCKETEKIRLLPPVMFGCDKSHKLLFVRFGID